MMLRLERMILFVGFITCVHIGSTGAYQIPSDVNGAIPVIACENSLQVYAVSCLATGSGDKFEAPRWFAWTGEGQSISIAEDNRKYNHASDGGQQFYLLITGAEISLDNNGERYNCYRPDIAPTEEVLRILEEHGAVLRVLPEYRCDEESPTTTIPLPSTVVTSSTITRTNNTIRNDIMNTPRLNNSQLTTSTQGFTQQANGDDLYPSQSGTIQEDTPDTLTHKTITNLVSTPKVKKNQTDRYVDDHNVTVQTLNASNENTATTIIPKASPNMSHTTVPMDDNRSSSPKSMIPSAIPTMSQVAMENSQHSEERQQNPVSKTDADYTTVVNIIYAMSVFVCLFLILNLVVLYKVSRLLMSRQREVIPSYREQEHNECFTPLQTISYSEESA